MTETPFDAEDVLQALIAQHAEVLTDEESGQRPLLLVRREASVSDAEDSGGRWSLDHLYVDADGVPTLVEVKRSSDTRGRREVVAQMLDYAANAKVSFTSEQMAAWLEDDAQVRGTTAAQALSETLGTEDPDAFWLAVAANMEAERFRLIFISDDIPRELRRIVEFLNNQMTRTDVLAIEVKQYVDSDGKHQTVVPRIIGNTEEAKRVKRSRSGRRRIDHASLRADLMSISPETAAAAEAILDWGEAQSDLVVRWNAAGDIRLDSERQPLLRVWPEGTVEVRIATLRKALPAWDDDERVVELGHRLESIDGVQFVEHWPRLKWPRTALAPLADQATREQFLAIIGELFSDLRAAAT